MGLDQYAYVKIKEQEQSEICYWRKHPNLQGWMERLWSSKYPEIANNESFNGIEIELSLEDLNQLQHDVIAEKLPSTEGFFFGNNSDRHYREHDLEFIANAKLLLLAGTKVYYNSSW